MHSSLRRACRFTLLILACVAAQVSLAQDGLIAPRAKTSPKPAQLTNARGVPVDGFVTVRYTVSADGLPSDVRAINFMPPTIDPNPTLEAVRTWTFFPGTSDGKAIDWFNNESIVSFRSQSGAGEDTAEFQQRYGAIAEMLSAENADFAAALKLNEELLGQYSTQLGDIGLAITQAAILNIGTGDLYNALDLIRLATDPSSDTKLPIPLTVPSIKPRSNPFQRPSLEIFVIGSTIPLL